MTITGSYTAALVGNLDRSQLQDTEVGIALLKKAQEQAANEAQALIEGITQPPPNAGDCGKLLDTYA